MSYKKTYDLARDSQITERLAVAIADVADDVYAESAGVAEHALRMALVAYAGPIASAYKAFAKEMALQLLTTNGTLSLTSTDAELKTAVSNMWTAYAKLMEARGVFTVVTP